MGMLQDGRWVDQWYNTKETDGRFVRKAPQFRNWITADGAPGQVAMAGSRSKPDAIISMSRWPALGRTER